MLFFPFILTPAPITATESLSESSLSPMLSFLKNNCDREGGDDINRRLFPLSFEEKKLSNRRLHALLERSAYLMVDKDEPIVDRKALPIIIGLLSPEIKNTCRTEVRSALFLFVISLRN